MKAEVLKSEVSITHRDEGTPFIYNLAAAPDEGSFYCELSDFTDDFLNRIDEETGCTVDRFISHLKKTGSEKIRSRNEYLIEPLIAGILWNEYGTYANKALTTEIALLSFFSTARKVHPAIKKLLDPEKGKLLTRMMGTPGAEYGADQSKSFTMLVRWLEATGEFPGEAERLQKWVRFLSTRPSAAAEQDLRKWMSLASEFSAEAGKRLGFYTRGVGAFRQNVPERNRNRENRLFCGRAEAEYHMNMFAAEVMNREFRRDFTAKKHKEVLLPACMASPADGRCRALGNKCTTCRNCTPTCHINKLTTELQKYTVAVTVIPHSSDFTRHLKKRAKDDTGLVGVACVLNLLSGGYAMKKLGIAAQCVFLNHSGCAKHWRGTVTSISSTQLFHVLGLGMHHEQ
jgi:hypothetical protein